MRKKCKSSIRIRVSGSGNKFWIRPDPEPRHWFLFRSLFILAQQQIQIWTASFPLPYLFLGNYFSSNATTVVLKGLGDKDK